MNGYLKPYPVGQGNLTKLFLDLHLLDRSFDLKIVALIWQRWYLLQPARPDSGVGQSCSYSGFIEVLVSCKHWSHDDSECKFVAENVVPVRWCFGCSTCHCFEFESVEAWPGYEILDMTTRLWQPQLFLCSTRWALGLHIETRLLIAYVSAQRCKMQVLGSFK
jgi:hypothetical protein